MANALVTGGGDGLGRVIAERLVAAGWRVLVTDVRAEAVAAARAALPGVEGEVADMGRAEDVRRAFAAARARLGPVTLVVNNVGIAGPHAAFGDIDEGEWRAVFDVNLHGAFHAIREALPDMRRAGGGAVVNISTGSVRTLPLRRAPYIVAKAALESLTLALARELGPEGIRVNAVRPGWMDNDRANRIVARVAAEQGRTPAEVEAEGLRYVSMRSKIAMREVADVVAFLASDAAPHVTGQIIAVDGNVEYE